MITCCEWSRSDVCVMVRTVVCEDYVRCSASALGVKSGEFRSNVLYGSVLYHCIYLSAFSVRMLVA